LSNQNGLLYCTMTKQQHFDRSLEILGFANGSELASALGLARKSSSYCRQNGVPESRLGDLMRLARDRGRDPIEMLEPVRSPAPAKQPQARAAQNDRLRRQSCRALRRDHRARDRGVLKELIGHGRTISGCAGARPIPTASPLSGCRRPRPPRRSQPWRRAPRRCAV
jgi:hypothetical protein